MAKRSDFLDWAGIDPLPRPPRRPRGLHHRREGVVKALAVEFCGAGGPRTI